MKIRILRSTVCDGAFVRPGDVIDADKHHATTLIQLGKAEPVDAVEAPTGPMTTETFAPAVETEVEPMIEQLTEAPKSKRGRPRRK
jgi:hypothetical protein